MNPQIKTTADLIAAVESNNDLWAYRFEPAHRPQQKFIDKMRTVASCSSASAQILCASSWGLYQIMGDELIDLGLTISPIKYCTDRMFQTLYFDEYLSKHHINLTLDELESDSQKRHMFARIYNGPDNVDAYVARMESFLK